VKPTAIVLCGGKERRFGRSKAQALVGDRTVMDRILSVLELVSGEIIAVTAPDKPDVPVGGRAKIVTDLFPGGGPLGGIYSGLLHAASPLAVVVACDMPFLSGALLIRMLGMADGFDAVVPRVGRTMVEPLHAVYAKSCLAEMGERLNSGHLSIALFLERIHVRYMSKEEYLPLDPRMLSFFNINYPEDFERANRIASEIDFSPRPRQSR